MACGLINGVVGSGALTVGSLGFKGVGCCRLPCPSLPLQHVRICVLVNKESQVQITQGCPVDLTGLNCVVSYGAGVVENSWGRFQRVVVYDRYVQAGTFIQLSFCGNAGYCNNGTNCGLGRVVDADDIYPYANKLLKFEIEGEDITRYLQVVADKTAPPVHKDGCVDVDLIDCTAVTPTFPADLSHVTWGSTITVGPIGERAWSVIA